MLSHIEQELSEALKHYQHKFTSKIYDEENNDIDLLMEVFNITPDLKRENRQYWGRELGACWELLLMKLFSQSCDHYSQPSRTDRNRPCDFIIGNHAIDAKYRIGSGDQGKKKVFEGYAQSLITEGYEPVLLVLRDDNLVQMTNACRRVGWKIFTGDETFAYIQQQSGFDLKQYLRAKAKAFVVQR